MSSMIDGESNPEVAVRIKGLARIGELLLGLWLFSAAFLWHHPFVQKENMWILGLCVMLVAAVGCIWSTARFVNAAIAVWLIAAVFALPRMEAGGTLSNVITALVLVGVSLVPTSAGPVVKQRPF